MSFLFEDFKGWKEYCTTHDVSLPQSVIEYEVDARHEGMALEMTGNILDDHLEQLKESWFHVWSRRLSLREWLRSRNRHEFLCDFDEKLDVKHGVETEITGLDL